MKNCCLKLSFDEKYYNLRLAGGIAAWSYLDWQLLWLNVHGVCIVVHGI